MLAIVCKTSDEVKLHEKYDAEGKISGDGGFHGLGSSIGRKITGRFVVICLEELRQVTYNKYVVFGVYFAIRFSNINMSNGTFPFLHLNIA